MPKTSIEGKMKHDFLHQEKQSLKEATLFYSFINKTDFNRIEENLSKKIMTEAHSYYIQKINNKPVAWHNSPNEDKLQALCETLSSTGLVTFLRMFTACS